MFDQNIVSEHKPSWNKALREERLKLVYDPDGIIEDNFYLKMFLRRSF